MEMRKIWTMPQAVVQQFAANEYVAACGDSGTTYNFECNAGGGERGDVFTEDGVNLTSGERHYYYACGTTHSASETDDFFNGYFVLNGGNDREGYYTWSGYHEYEKIPVIIWNGDGHVHCTTKLNMSDWETAKS